MADDHDEFAGKAFADPVVREGYRKAAERRGRQLALVEAYWKLRDHADALRETKGYQRLAELYRNDRDNEQEMRQYLLLKARYDGIDDGARDLAELLGVPEWEIERPPGTSEVTDDRP